MIKGVTPEECIADLFEIIQRYSVKAPLKILLNSRSFILTNGRRWFGHVDLIYRQKHFMNVQRGIGFSGAKIRHNASPISDIGLIGCTHRSNLPC